MKNYLTNQIQKVKSRAQPFLLFLTLFLLGFSKTVYASEDPFAKTQNLAQQGITRLQVVSLVIFGLAVVVTGIIYGVGGRELKAAMKKNWVSIAVGIIAVAAGPSILEWFYNFVTN